MLARFLFLSILLMLMLLLLLENVDYDHEHENKLRFGLARHAGWRLLSLRLMRFCYGKFASILSAAAIALICSCEKHHVGEMPEVQKEHPDPAAGHEEGKGEGTERSTLPALPAKPTPTPTPAEFFPEKPR